MLNTRKLIISEEEYCYCTRGSYGHIFISANHTRCWKVFVKENEEIYARESFESELAAYLLLKTHPNLTKYAPELYRSRCGDFRVINGNGLDKTREYYSMFNYEMEYCRLDFVKIGALPCEDTRLICEKFKGAGIHYLKDASIGFDQMDEPKLIDFGVKDIEVNW